MLVLSRKPGERIVLGNIVVTVVSVSGNRVRLGFTAPADVPIRREELRPTAGRIIASSLKSVQAPTKR
jgi:carbon storage regulator